MYSSIERNSCCWKINKLSLELFTGLKHQIATDDRERDLAETVFFFNHEFRLPNPDTENTHCCVNPGLLALPLSASRMGLPLWGAQTEGSLMNFAQALMEVSRGGQWTEEKNKAAETLDKAASSPEFTQAEQT